MDKKILATESLDEFIDALIEMHGLNPLDRYLLNLLFEIKKGVPLQTKKFLTLCLSLLDDGNTRIALDAKQFSATWTKKWNGLVTLRISSTDEEMSESDFATASDFDEIISGGIQDILTNDFSAIMESRGSDETSVEDEFGKPFVLAKRQSGTHLYFTKHFDDKCVIEKSAKTLFKNGCKPSDKQIAQCTDKIANICKPFANGKPFIKAK